jgi:probable rRNA maturation factor
VTGAERTRVLYLPPWRIDVTVRAGVVPLVSDAVLARTAAAALDAAGAPSPASIGLILSDDAELARLNAEHMGESVATDVLSFPLLPPDVFPPHQGAERPGPAGPAFALPPGTRQHLGDIVVSVERAIAQASAGRGGQTGNVSWAPADELRLLVTHGVFHICGWDHADPVEEAAMRALEQQILGEEPVATSSGRAVPRARRRGTTPGG